MCEIYEQIMNYPHLVVAVVCEENNSVLMVNEIDNGINCWNQPAGHLELGESLEQAAVREALEETGYKVELTGIQGIYQGIHQESKTHYVRVCFRAKALTKTKEALDPDILKAEWLSKQALLRGDYTLRSEITRQTLEESDNAPHFPLSLIHKMFPGDSQ